jgi:hypothetical protein
VRGTEHRRLVGDEIDDAVGDDEVEAFESEIERFQPLYVALQEANVGTGVAEPVPMPFEMAVRDLQLLGRGIDPYHLAGFAHQLRQQIGVLSRS